MQLFEKCQSDTADSNDSENQSDLIVHDTKYRLNQSNYFTCINIFHVLKM